MEIHHLLLLHHKCGIRGHRYPHLPHQLGTRWPTGILGSIGINGNIFLVQLLLPPHGINGSQVQLPFLLQLPHLHLFLLLALLVLPLRSQPQLQPQPPLHVVLFQLGMMEAATNVSRSKYVFCFAGPTKYWSLVAVHIALLKNIKTILLKSQKIEMCLKTILIDRF